MVESPFPTDSSFLTPFHLIVFAFASLSLIATQLDLPPEIDEFAAMWRRVTLLLVSALLVYHVVVQAISAHREKIDRYTKVEKGKFNITAKGKMKKQPNAWENESAHPSAFLTTKDGKPRVWPFPLGKAGGTGTKELWWEAGNASHIGHFKQNETPEAREQLRLEMEAKEAKRLKKAEKAMKEFEGKRNMWHSRLTKLKTIGAIVAIGVFQKTIAAVCLAALIYWTIATRLAGMMKPPGEPDPEVPGLKRKKIPTVPGMAMTYIYEPNGAGGVQVAGAMPTKAPSNRLTTSTDNRYAS